ncbi:FIGNL1-interacting regulator of recombination and mitosis-like isoform X1 [Linepithema humile]|uniref:FIGNL1-interacting regulator of recombination and mitosis-like isoform X1 n=1 Tax=Linepithema humile TaxID=83485 RepID=UPI0006234BF0|nr:PREDICTED: uncharacterized protein C1orf112-like isoform X2 [Linepithema humile]
MSMNGSTSPTAFECSFELEDLDSQVSMLQVLLENESLDAEQLVQMLEQCFRMCSTESLDKQIFRKILPKAQHFLSQVLRAIDDTITHNSAMIDDDLDDIKCKLRVCNELLTFWRRCVEHISRLQKVPVVHVMSLCDILPETIKVILEHCKASPRYGVFLSGAMEQLKNLFAKAGAIFKLFFATLNGVIVFDTDVQSETELLTKVIDAHGSIASIACGMDTKTYIELSEAFAKLAITYQSDIKQDRVTTHLVQMVKDASCFLSAIKDQKDQKDKNAERNVIAITRLLKILEKLTAIYGACFTHETLSELVELLAQLHRYSCLNLTRGGERTILVSAASFLDIIFNHEDFKEVYFKYGRQVVSHGQYADRLSYHLLTIAIMKKLNGMPCELQCEWSLSSDSVLDIALIFMDHLNEEICAEDLRLPGAHKIGERPRLAGIYEATLVPFCGLISQIPPESFHALELILLKHLLSGCFWRSLLSSDIWCFIGRLGTSQLCVDHIKHMIKVSVVLAERRDSVEAIMLDNTIVRLYMSLTEDTKFALLNSLIDLYTDNYTPILYMLMAETKGFSLERLKHKLDDLPRAFSDLQEHPSIRNWKHLLQLVSATTAIDYSDNKDIIEILTKLWIFVKDAITECEGKQLDILFDLVVILLDSTHLGNLQDDAFCAILTSITTSYAHLPPRAKIKICHLLRRCVANLERCRVQNVTSTLIELFSCLLEDENIWVRQEALETFECVGHECSEQLVAVLAKALAKIPNISNIMQAYLSSKPYYVLKEFANSQDYLRHLAKAIQDLHEEHTCREYNESEREEKMPKLEEKENSHTDIVLPISVQLDERAEGLYKELMKVLEGRAVISDATCKKLIAALEKILQSREK